MDKEAAIEIMNKDSPGGHPYRRPRDAATLIIVDRAGPLPKVLLGRRHERHAFMPGKFVFPGGRVDRGDRYAPFGTPLDPATEAKLMAQMRGATPLKARALALAAIRETFEEAGLLLGKRADQPTGKRKKFSAPWDVFADTGILPDLSAIAFVARAVTPPGRARRFDTRFFTTDANAIAHRIDGVSGQDAELVELVWLPIEATRDIDMPGITRAVLRELQARIAAGFAHSLAVPMFHHHHGQIRRELL